VSLNFDDDLLQPFGLSPEDVSMSEAEQARVERRKARVPSPGPWSYEDTQDMCCGRPCTPEGCHESHASGLYHIVGPDWYDYDTVYPDVVCNLADARLIAAAPELLAACKEALGLLGREGHSVMGLLSAIAKAEGRS
jgi:hypothetical protein